MGDVGDYWREHKAHQRKLPKPDDDYTMGEVFSAFRDAKKERHALNFERNTAAIKELGFEHVVKNEGHHVIFLKRFHFWPASGKWWDQKTNRRGHGLDRLKKLLSPESKV